MMPQILFLVGMPRSGTKLLRDMLNKHPDIALFPVESHFLPYFAKHISKYGDLLNQNNFARFYADFQRTMFSKNLVTRDIVIDGQDWYANVSGSTYGHLLSALFQTYAQLTGCRIVGDKTPAYITETPLILENIPRTRFIHIVRDPRDYVLSIRKAWNQDVTRATQLWKHSIRKFHEDLNARNVHYCEVRYEDVLASTRATLFRVCEYLDIDFSEDMLVLEKPSENLGDAKGTASIVQTNFGKWETQLSDKEVQLVESISGELMSEFGYSVRFSAGDYDIGPLRMNLLRAKDTWNRFRFVLGEEKTLRSALLRMSKVGRF